MRKEINPVVAVIIILVLAGISAGIYFVATRPRDKYDAKKASEINAARGARAFQSMQGTSGGTSGGYRGSSGGYRGSSGGYQGSSGGYRGSSGGYQGSSGGR